MEVLLVCTGNVCRSRLAEAKLLQLVSGRSLDVEVASAGTLGANLAVPDEVSRLLGVEPTSMRRGAQLTRGQLAEAGLVVCMAREHLREAVVLQPECWPRAFTLKELVRRGRQVGARPSWRSIEQHLARLSRDRRRAELLGEHAEDDVSDPYGQQMDVYEAAKGEIDALLTELVSLLWPES